ncbi:MAG: DUF2333 family protein [Gammaproteobacteria bacterium]|nr:DUF2333 family protein [Gammaproteobacteria bacterium]
MAGHGGDVWAACRSTSVRASAWKRLNTDLAGDTGVQHRRPAAMEVETRTPWARIDDVLLRGAWYSWALIQFLEAIEVDFADVAEKERRGEPAPDHPRA